MSVGNVLFIFLHFYVVKGARARNFSRKVLVTCVILQY